MREVSTRIVFHGAAEINNPAVRADTVAYNKEKISGRHLSPFRQMALTAPVGTTQISLVAFALRPRHLKL